MNRTQWLGVMITVISTIILVRDNRVNNNIKHIQPNKHIVF